MTAHERLHALHERLLRPARHEQHAHARSGLLGETAGQLDQGDHPGRVVVGPGHDSRGADLGEHAGRARGDHAARQPQPALPVSAPSAASAGPAKTGNINGGLVSLRSIRAGNRRQANAGIPGVEDQAGLGRVVVRDQHHGPAGVRRPHLRDDVVGVAPGSRRRTWCSPPVMSSHTPAAAVAEAPCPPRGCVPRRARRARRRRSGAQAAPSSRHAPARSRCAPRRRARPGGPRPTRRLGARPARPRAGGWRPARSPHRAGVGRRSRDAFGDGRRAWARQHSERVVKLRARGRRRSRTASSARSSPGRFPPR